MFCSQLVILYFLKKHRLFTKKGKLKIENPLIMGGAKEEHKCYKAIDSFFNFFAIKDRGATKVLAMITLIGTPIFVVLVNVFLSYRLDPAGFFVEHSSYNYTDSVLTPRESYNRFVVFFF